MRLLVSWLRDFVDAPASPHDIADRLGLRGFEVAAVEPLEKGDAVIDLEVTANRPDCLGVLGLAREVATAYGLAFRLPSSEPGAKLALAPVPTGASDRVTVSLDEAALCPRYAAAVAELAPSVTPGWMTSRLHASGIRPISPIVDITNYVLMEIGHPMHAFDLASLAGAELRIRRARRGESLTTLDGVSRPLDEEMLVIADAREPQAIAGVMGGAAAEVSPATRTVAFESACFKPSSVRRTSKRLGLKTEASARFERGADVNAPVVALQRAMALMHQIGAGRALGPIVDCYPEIRLPKAIRLRRARLALVLGLAVPDEDVVRILRSLGLEVAPGPDGWTVGAPTFRVDLVREVDLIEEVGRHYGFDRLEPSFPATTSAAPPPDPRVRRNRAIRQALTAAGLSEAVTFGVIEERAAALFAAADRVIKVKNPLSAKFDTLRPSLLPGLVDAVAHNRRHGRRDVALFEIGARFSPIDGETDGVGFAWTGPAEEHWAHPSRDVDFFDIKGAAERVCGIAGVRPGFEAVELPFLVPGQAASLSAAGAPIGLVGLLAPAVAESRGVPRGDKVLVGELDLERIWTLGEGAGSLDGGPAALDRVRPLPRFPSVVRDLSIVVSDRLPAEIIRGTIQRAGGAGSAPLVATSFFDRYKGKGLPDDSVSLSVRLTFQADDRTLTDAEVQETFDGIVAALAKEHAATQR
jgi:phenylalanyl-tRNA synthetase beta chain